MEHLTTLMELPSVMDAVFWIGVFVAMAGLIVALRGEANGLLVAACSFVVLTVHSFIRLQQLGTPSTSGEELIGKLFILACGATTLVTLVMMISYVVASTRDEE